MGEDAGWPLADSRDQVVQVRSLSGDRAGQVPLRIHRVLCESLQGPKSLYLHIFGAHVE